MSATAFPIDLWSQATPWADGSRSEEEMWDGDALLVRNVVRPSITPYLPDASVANGTAVIVAPGGGFHFLAWDYEGTDVAEWLAARGVAAFLLKYRLADTGPTPESFRTTMDAVMQRLIGEALGQGGVDVDNMAPEIRRATEDGEQAVRVVRGRASEWHVDPGRIGFLGFSAGAFVATGTALSVEPAARPDFVAAIYGGQVAEPVPEWAPPLFAVVTADDALCRRTTIDTARAWVEAGRPAELHVYERGGHGFGARKLGLPVDGWMERLADWMHSGGYLC